MWTHRIDVWRNLSGKKLARDLVNKSRWSGLICDSAQTRSIWIGTIRSRPARLAKWRRWARNCKRQTETIGPASYLARLYAIRKRNYHASCTPQAAIFVSVSTIPRHADPPRYCRKLRITHYARIGLLWRTEQRFVLELHRILFDTWSPWWAFLSYRSIRMETQNR
jgi:hypothetical protein